MNEAQAREILLASLGEVAPETDAATIDADVPLGEQLDLDSMDFLNLIVAVAERTGIEVPERDYARFATLGDAVTYLVQADPS
jgi:acyl carrier protein